MRILTITLLLTSTICSAQIGARTKQSSQLTGIWQNNQFGYQMTLMLNPDGTGEFDGDEVKYTAKGGVLALTIVSQQTTNNYNYSLAGNSLTVSGGDLDQPVTFARAGSEQPATAVSPSVPLEQPPSNPSNPDPAPAINNAATDKALLGTWSSNGETIDFKPDGTCIYLGNTFRYQANQGNITLASQQGSGTLGYTVKGNQLVLSANGQQLTYTKGTAAAGAKSVPQELVGKWCWANVTNTNSGSASSDKCITLNGDGSYQYYSERSMSVNDPSFAGGTNSQNSDRGTWWIQGDRIYYNSQTQGTGSYRLEKRNHPKNVNDPMIVLDGEPYVTAFQKAPWR
ncbi:MAG TPA: hypothetical protein VK508_13245 [Cyclobacteriaceae bacterium]|nr:hypothetical protein [Cyclobacteriaceae bacterium]